MTLAVPRGCRNGTPYAVYQFVCAYDGTAEQFEHVLLAKLVLQRKTLLERDPSEAVSVTINSVVHSKCMYLMDGKPVVEQSATVQVAVNPRHNSMKDGVLRCASAAPYAAFLAEEMRLHFRQTIVPVSAISPADTVFAAASTGLFFEK